jgi:hypothetical protein
MRLTVITDSNGSVTGTVKGHSKDFESGEFRAGLIIGTGEKKHEIEVPDEYERMNAEELHKKVKEHIKKS